MIHKKLGSFNYILGNKNDVNEFLKLKIRKKKSFILLPTSLNDLASVDLDLSLNKYYRKIDYCTTDGVPLVWYFNLIRLFHLKKPIFSRVYGPTLMKDLTSPDAGQFRHYFFGSSLQTIKYLEINLRRSNQKSKFVDFVSPPFRKLALIEEARYLAEIRRKKIDVLWIGLSSPKQVILAARWKQFLPNTAIICVGAAFDFLADKQLMAPLFLQNFGLEWLFRLLVDPFRLWKRYLVVIPIFLLRKIYKNISFFL